MNRIKGMTLILAMLLIGGCGVVRAIGSLVPGPSSEMSEGLRIAERYRVDAISDRRFNHADYWRALAPALRSDRLRVADVGHSMQGRELRTVTFGTGPVTVLLWSQMHGDESTASMALADIFAWLGSSGSDGLRDRLEERLTITFLPLLNPDGAERFQRENAAGIDINRDARRLSTPEGQLLKSLQERLRPQFGFNLHDQNARTRVGRNGLQAGIALLAPAADEERSWGPVRSRARLVAAGIAKNLETTIANRVAKYDDAFNPRAFGDLMQTWGTSTVLIESGALPDDPDKQELRKINVAAIIGALDAIATEDYAKADLNDYERLPFNTSGAYDLLVRGADLVIPGSPPLRADVAINYDDPVARTGGRVREVGDLSAVVAIDTVEAAGGFLHPRNEALAREGSRTWMPIGSRAVFDLRDGPQVTSRIRQRIER